MRGTSSTRMRFKPKNQPDHVVVFRTANTEYYSHIIPGTKLKSVLAEFKSKKISKNSWEPFTPTSGTKGKAAKDDHPDHIVVIQLTINVFNECDDSLLATPLVLDLADNLRNRTHLGYTMRTIHPPRTARRGALGVLLRREFGRELGARDCPT
ncbi:hypothetical protein J3R83DRAFT_7486 [Lanmaoa asiatica]|nr:hypothetical protein J3R83DRAFT_7486 [Lanmaoa asiatica]